MVAFMKKKELFNTKEDFDKIINNFTGNDEVGL